MEDMSRQSSAMDNIRVTGQADNIKVTEEKADIMKGRDPQVEELIKKARQAKIDAASDDADQFIAEMMENPLQPRVVSNEDVYLMESLKSKGLKIKPQWEDVTNEDGSTSKRKTGWSDVLIPER